MYIINIIVIKNQLFLQDLENKLLFKQLKNYKVNYMNLKLKVDYRV